MSAQPRTEQRLTRAQSPQSRSTQQIPTDRSGWRELLAGAALLVIILFALAQWGLSLYLKQESTLHRCAQGDSRGDALMEAAASGDLLSLRVLLDHGCGVNDRDASGRTPLIIAAEYDQPQVCRMLIARYADVNATNGYGWTALQMAALTGASESGKMLIAANAGVNVATATGSTPLMMAARSGKLELVRALLAAGADDRAVDQSRAGALEYAARCSEDTSVLKALIDLGLDVNAADDSGQTPLMTATEADNVAGVRLLIERGAAVAMRDAKGNSALSHVDPGTSAEIKRLLQARLALEQARRAN